MSDDLQQLADDYWEATLRLPADRTGTCSATTPTSASWEHVSREAEERHVAELRDFAARAEAVDPDGLDDEQRLTREVLIASATHHRRPAPPPR